MMKTNCPCGGLLNPTVAGQLFVWQVHVRLYGFVLSLALSFLVTLYVFFKCLFSWHLVLDLCLVFSGTMKTVWPTDLAPLTSQWAGRLVPSLSHGRISLSRSCLFVRLWCNQLKLTNTGSAVTHSILLDPPLVVSITTAPFTIPQIKLIRLRVNKVKTFSDVTSYTSLCLLNLRASTKLSLREKNQ